MKKRIKNGLYPYAVYNIGNSAPVNLLDFEAHKRLVPMPPGDVPITCADTTALERDYGFKPATPLREGLKRFAQWYKEFYSV